MVVCRLESNSIGGYYDDDADFISTPEGPKAIADALLANAELTDLNLNGNNLEDDGVSAVCDAVHNNKQTKISSLNLGYNGCGPAGAKSVAAMLAVTAELTKCKLRGNQLGVDGWTYIFNALRDSPTSKITEWDLSEERLGPTIATPLAEYLTVTASLTSLE